MMRLGEVKKLFPGAKYEEEKPAWAKEEDKLYSVTGEGIQGTIIIKFHDPRPFYRKQISESNDNVLKEIFTPYANGSPDESLEVQWVRWIPDKPFPVERMINKYGKPDINDYSSEDFQPFKQWETQGIVATLSDDGKNVLNIEYYFVKEDYPEHIQIIMEKYEKKKEGKKEWKRIK